MRYGITIGAVRRTLAASVAALAVGAAGAAIPATAGAQLALNDFAAPMLDRNGNEETRAGARAFVVENVIDVQRTSPLQISGSLKDVIVDMPVGFVGDPSEIPTCPMRTASLTDCPRESQIGVFELTTFMNFRDPVYNMEVPEGQPARFGVPAVMGAANVYFDASVRPEDDGITVTSSDTTHLYPIGATKLTLWGVPADPAHDADRGGPSGSDPVPFLTLPTRCTGEPMVTRMRTNSWQNPNLWVYDEYVAPPVTGCEQLDFGPKVKVQPDHTVAGTPAGYTVELTQRQATTADSRSTAHLKDAVVALPKGVTINPAAADGLTACSEEQVGMGKDGAATCPQSSKIGEVTIDTPVLDQPLTGGVYQAAQNANPFGSTLAIYMVPENDRYGVRMKLAGEVKTDPATGRVTTTFMNNPEQPFSKLTLRLKGGDRAVLTNPITCGTKTTEWSISSWARPGEPVSGTDAFAIDRAPAGGSCANDLFAPGFTAGTVEPVAGASSPFSMTFARADGHQNLATIDVKLPEGLLGKVGSVPLCPEAHANLGACGPASRVGHVVAQVGSGSSPLAVPQAGKAPTQVFLSGPYKGAPFSLSMQVPAQAGPLNLGTVVARVGLFVDANDASITARLMDSRVFDHKGTLQQTIPFGMPQIVDGIPMAYRAITVNMDLPGFMVNPTSCAPKTINAAIGSITGAVVNRAARFQVGDCGALELDPTMRMAFTGDKETDKGKHPGLDVEMRQGAGQSGLRKVEVALPLSVALDPDNAKALCTPQQATARACPPESIVGNASAVTPILDRPLSGPVYFVEGIRTTDTGRQVRTLPKLLITLRGQVALDLMADSDVEDDKLVTTFPMVPDAPIESFKLTINGGENGILKNTGTNGDTLCHSTQKMETRFEGQNGKRATPTFQIDTPCSMRVLTSSVSTSRLTVRAGGLERGRLTVSGSHVRRTSRSITTAQAATIKPRLSQAGRRAARAGRQVRATVTFTPAAKDAKAVRKTVTARTPRR